MAATYRDYQPLRGSGGEELRSAPVSGRDLRRCRRQRTHAPRQLRRAPGDGPDPVSVDPPDASHATRATSRRSLKGNGNTDSHRSWLLGVGTLLRFLPGIVWRIAFGISTQTPRPSLKDQKPPVI